MSNTIDYSGILQVISDRKTKHVNELLKISKDKRKNNTTEVAARVNECDVILSTLGVKMGVITTPEEPVKAPRRKRRSSKANETDVNPSNWMPPSEPLAVPAEDHKEW